MVLAAEKMMVRERMMAWLRANDVLEGCEAVMVRLGTELLLAWSAFWVSPSWWRWRSVNASTRNEREAEKRKRLARTTRLFKVVEGRRRRRREEDPRASGGGYSWLRGIGGTYGPTSREWLGDGGGKKNGRGGMGRRGCLRARWSSWRELLQGIGGTYKPTFRERWKDGEREELGEEWRAEDA